MKILCTGGGSVGHIAPAVAVWHAYATLNPQTSVLFVCSPRPDDAAFLKKNDLPHTVFKAPRLSVMFPIAFAKAVREAKRILETENPDCIFSKGGYVSLPICFAAHKRGIPIVTHESDAVSGYANRLIARWATRTCTGFPLHTKTETTYTGNPVRKETYEGSKQEGLRISGLDGKRPILLVSGGSQGSVAINDAVTSMLDDILLRCDVLHVTGHGKATDIEKDGYFQTEFAHEELAHFYACADIAVSRAGAGSIAEHAANGIPTILIPLRGVGHDHQYANAVSAAMTGGCLHLEQSDMEKNLLNTIHLLITDGDKRTAMSKAIRTLHKQDAALQIAKIIAGTLDSHERDQ